MMSEYSNQPPKHGVIAAHTAIQAGVEQAAAALSTRFELRRVIRADAHALRFAGRELATGAEVHVCALQPAFAPDQRQRELFYLEASAAARLEHFNTARCTRPQEFGGLHYCVMEHKAESQTLRDVLRRQGWLAVQTACQIADQIAAALDDAHRIGVLHLQLAPERILVEAGGWATVTGFGIEMGPGLEWAHQERARQLDAAYASPEHWGDAACTPQSDLYSLGAILYEMLTDRVPFDSDDDSYVRERKAEYSPVAPHLISMDVPVRVSNVVMKLLERRPVNRFITAAEFQFELDHAWRGEPVPGD